jgi:transcriptional regulator with XRE-family HTH domain
MRRKNMRVRRAELNLTQKDLCDRTGVSQAFLSSIERGVCMPAADVAVRLAKELHMTVEELLQKDDASESQQATNPNNNEAA